MNKQLNITICKSKGDGDLAFRHKRLILTEEDIAYIEDACKKIYQDNNGNISDIYLDEWVKIFNFKDLYAFFVKKEIPTILYYCNYKPLLQWDPEVTIKTKNKYFKYSKLSKILKCWSLGHKRIRTCWGNNEDMIPDFFGWYESER